MKRQKTLSSRIECSGIGLHSGKKVHIEILPAAPGTGVLFQRTDIDGPRAQIETSWKNLDQTQFATNLSKDGVEIRTVEHLMGALAICEIDNAIVRLNAPEVPIMDGSAAPFIYLLNEAGIEEQNAPKRFIKITRRFSVRDDDKWISVEPYNGFRMDYSIEFDHPAIRKQAISLEFDPRNLSRRIAPARTFGFLHEIRYMRKNGLCLGGSLENAIVLDKTSVMNSFLRYPDEFVRHKALDAIGDLYMLGAPLLGKITIHKGGHALHGRFVRELIVNEKRSRRYVYASAVAPRPEQNELARAI